MLTKKQLLLLLLLPITGMYEYFSQIQQNTFLWQGWALKCRVCSKGKKDYKWQGGLFGGECGKGRNQEGRLVDFDNKGKNGENVSCLHFSDGIRSWRGAIDKTIEDKCYFNMPSVSFRCITIAMYIYLTKNRISSLRNECIAFAIQMIAIATLQNLLAIVANVRRKVRLVKKPGKPQKSPRTW